MNHLSLATWLSGWSISPACAKALVCSPIFWETGYGKDPPVSPALRTWTQEDQKLKVILGHIRGLRLGYVVLGETQKKMEGRKEGEEKKEILSPV